MSYKGIKDSRGQGFKGLSKKTICENLCPINSFYHEVHDDSEVLKRLCVFFNLFIMTTKTSDVYFFQRFIDGINQPIFMVYAATVYFFFEIF